MTSQHRRNVRLQALLGLTLCAAGCATQAQTISDDESSASTQLWGNLILGFGSGKPWYFETDIEPKVLVSDGQPWRNLDVTQSFEHYPNRYFDLIGEVVGGYTHQSDDVDTVELTERVGVRVNLLNHRAGLGYRISRAYRVELLYMREWTRDAAEGQKRPDSNIFDVRFKRYF